MEKRLRLTALKKKTKRIYTPHTPKKNTRHIHLGGQGVLFFVSGITKLEINGH